MEGRPFLVCYFRRRRCFPHPRPPAPHPGAVPWSSLPPKDRRASSIMWRKHHRTFQQTQGWDRVERKREFSGFASISILLRCYRYSSPTFAGLCTLPLKANITTHVASTRVGTQGFHIRRRWCSERGRDVRAAREFHYREIMHFKVK